VRLRIDKTLTIFGGRFPRRCREVHSSQDMLRGNCYERLRHPGRYHHSGPRGDLCDGQRSRNPTACYDCVVRRQVDLVKKTGDVISNMKCLRAKQCSILSVTTGLHIAFLVGPFLSIILGMHRLLHRLH